MGIPRYAPNLKKRYARAFSRNLTANRVGSLLIDLNGLFHETAQDVYAYREPGSLPISFKDKTRLTAQVEARKKYIAELYQSNLSLGLSQIDAYNVTKNQLKTEHMNAIKVRLTTLLVNMKPEHTLIIAVDGAVPAAKLAQQRARRFGGSKEAAEAAAAKPKRGRKKTTVTPKFFSSNALTPGTDYMFSIDKAINEWLTQNRGNLPSKTIYSSHMSPGEGEHKIMDYIRQGDVVSDGAHVIWGLDADLIMLSLLAPLQNIFLYKEYVVLDYSIGSEQMGLEALRDEFLNIEFIKDGIYSDLGRSSAIADYVVMMTTIGNDFLPHQPSLEELDQSIDQMIAAYREISTPLTVQNGLDYQINLNGMTEWFKMMGQPRVVTQTQPQLLPSMPMIPGSPAITGASVPTPPVQQSESVPSRESELIRQRARTTYKFPLPALINSVDPFGNYSFDVFRDNWYTDIFSPHDIEAAQAAGINTNVTDSDITNMCYQYIGGIAWVLIYYTKGPSAVNNRWYYPYYHAPLFVDTAAILDYIVTSQNIDVLPYWDRLPNQVEINVLWQLIAVLPISSADLLPEIIRSLASTMSVLADYYPVDFDIERWGVNQEWRGIPILPFVDIDRIANIVNRQRALYPAEYFNKYDQVNDIMIDRSTISREEVLAQMQQTAAQMNQRFVTGRERGTIVRTPANRGRRGSRGRGRGRGRGSFRGGSRRGSTRQTTSTTTSARPSGTAATKPVINKPTTVGGALSQQSILASLMASAIAPNETIATGRSLGGQTKPSRGKKRKTRGSARGSFRGGSRGRGRGSFRGGSRGRGRGSFKGRGGSRGRSRGRGKGRSRGRGRGRGSFSGASTQFVPQQTSFIPTVPLTPQTSSRQTGSGLGGVRLPSSTPGSFGSKQINF